MQTSNKNLVILLVIIIVAIICLIGVIIFLSSQPKISSTSSAPDIIDQTPDSVLVNNKDAGNPTFSDLGYSIKSNNKLKQVVKVIDVKKSNNVIILTAQLNNKPDSKQDIQIYDPKIIKSVLVDIINSDHIFTITDDSKIISSGEEIFNLMNQNKNKNIVLKIYTEIEADQLKSFTECNKKLANNIKENKNIKLECTPAVWDFSIHEN